MPTHQPEAWRVINPVAVGAASAVLVQPEAAHCGDRDAAGSHWRVAVVRPCRAAAPRALLSLCLLLRGIALIGPLALVAALGAIFEHLMNRTHRNQLNCARNFHFVGIPDCILVLRSSAVSRRHRGRLSDGLFENLPCKIADCPAIIKQFKIIKTHIFQLLMVLPYKYCQQFVERAKMSSRSAVIASQISRKALVFHASGAIGSVEDKDYFGKVTLRFGTDDKLSVKVGNHILYRRTSKRGAGTAATCLARVDSIWKLRGDGSVFFTARSLYTSADIANEQLHALVANTVRAALWLSSGPPAQLQVDDDMI